MKCRKFFTSELIENMTTTQSEYRNKKDEEKYFQHLISHLINHSAFIL